MTIAQSLNQLIAQHGFAEVVDRLASLSHEQTKLHNDVENHGAISIQWDQLTHHLEQAAIAAHPLVSKL